MVLTCERANVIIKIVEETKSKNFLPSKKALSVMVLVAGVSVASIITFGGKTAEKAIETVGEVVGGTNIKIPDNPNWKNDLELAGNRLSGSEEVEGDTVTDSLSRSLISNYISLKQGGQLDEETKEQLINQASDYVGTVGERNFSEVNLKIIKDNGLITVGGYGELLGRLLWSNTPAKPLNELGVISKAMQSGKQEDLKDLENIIYTYKKIESGLLNMSVPNTFVKSHTDLVIGIRGIIAGLEEMQHLFDDPIKSVVGLQLYQEGGVRFSNAMQATINYIKSSDYDYKQGSGGYYLINGL